MTPETNFQNPLGEDETKGDPATGQNIIAGGVPDETSGYQGNRHGITPNEGAQMGGFSTFATDTPPRYPNQGPYRPSNGRLNQTTYPFYRSPKCPAGGINGHNLTLGQRIGKGKSIQERDEDNPKHKKDPSQHLQEP
ncbi:hypothetical protein A2982_03315 [candidate division WWE3 bacterium RIFCSPLOWO2_01_FULL_39_13]|uniref:Uncharacterized protein n=1 Tax=candidate division WWE3 bacterium RIFCSPLOWO2_01_FULL_39_13 TaxID=1802624 RepID=A0A1F4V387_UNCKA|nr:MAG: hypothetical protein A2982_03315 [candidate division WWE3 bacterium RIFCSPLOWO2_01_FULL_39_13]